MGVVDFKNDTRIDPQDRVVLREFCSLLGGDPAVLAGRLGVKVYERRMDASVDGYIEHDPDCGSTSGYKVVLNMHATLARKKFTLAHELGHYVLHKGSAEFQQAKATSAEVFDFPSGFRSSDAWDYAVGADEPGWMKHEADQFAACVLLPAGLLKQTEEFKNGAPMALARRLNLSAGFVTRRFEESYFG